MSKSFREQMLELSLVKPDPKAPTKKILLDKDICPLCGNELSRIGFCPQCKVKMR